MENTKMKMYARQVLALTAATLLAGGSIIIVAPQSAKATPQYAQQTGKPCGQCHQNPTGGKLKPFGENFKKNGYKL